MTQYQKILVPIDGSETSRRGLQQAIDLAKITKGQLRLFHVIDDLSFAVVMDAYAGYTGDWIKILREQGTVLLDEGQRAASAAGVSAEGILHESFNTRLPDAVADEARQWQADLIIVGTHGRRGVGRFWLGSGAERILRSAPVPVMLVGPERPAAREEEEAPATIRISQPAKALSIE